MKNFTRKIPDKSRKTALNRWLGWLTFSLMLLLGQFTWGQGQTCNNPLVISSIPFNASGNTSSYGSNYSSGDVPPAAPGVTTPSSSYLGGDDVVFSISPLINGEITLTASNLGTWSGMYVFTGCPFTLTVGHITGSAGGTKEISDLVVTAGETYYIVISTWPSPQSTDFTLDVTGTPGLLTPLTNCTGTPDGGIASLTPSGGNAGSTFMAKATDVSIAIGMEYQWQKFVGGAWVDIAGATTINSPITAESSVVGTITDYRLKATCTLSNETEYSTVASFTIQLVYCTPVYSLGCGNGARVNDVITSNAITNINNTDTGCGSTTAPLGYIDYTGSHEMSVGRGMSFDIEVGVSNYSGGVKVWIDYNQNGTFEEDELVTASAAVITSGNSHTATISVPPTALVGQTRMRVRVVENSTTFDACGSASYGEAEDYAIEIIQLSDCVGTPIAGTVTSPINICANESFTLTTLGATAPADGLLGIWQSSPAGMNTWSDVVGATSTSHTMASGVTSNTDFRYKMTCSHSNETDFSDSIVVTMNAATDCYCIPTGTSTTNYINDFTTTGGAINISNLNNGLSADGYGDFTFFHNVTQDVGGTINFEAAMAGTTTSGFKIWVDWNQNGSFDDAGELVYTSNSYLNIRNGSFVVPFNALAGQTRMRIGNASSTTTGPAGPCLTNLSGEYEDYMFTVTIPSCMPVGALSVSNLTANSADLSWTSDGTLFDIEWGEEGFVQGAGTTISGVSNPYILNGLNADTSYSYYVRQDCGTTDGQSVWSGPYTFFTGYCVPTTTGTYYLTGVSTTGGYSNIAHTATSKAPNGYANLSATGVVSASPGDEIGVSMTTNSGTHYFYIWIDLNNNLSFNDPGETIVAATTSYSASYSGTITIPTDLPLGDYRVRIGNSWSGIITPCGSANGEYKDFTLSVIAPPTCLVPTNLAVSNITTNSVDLSWTSDGTLFDVELVEEGTIPTGTPTHTGVANPFTAINLTPSTSYEFYVRQDCGTVDGTSIWVGPFKFTTECLPPSITETTGDTICGEGEANLTVVTDGDVVSWYTSETGGIKIGSGATFTTPLNTETTSYYAEAGFIVPNVTTQIGTATTTSTGSGTPYYHSWGGTKTQYIYKAEELLAAGLISGPITSISFDVTSAGSNLSDFTIHIGSTTQELATATHVSGLTLVYSNANQATTVGLNTYSLTGTFVWDGTSNIVVQTSFSNVNTGGTSASTRYHLPGSNLTTYTYADNRTAQQILDTMTGGVSDGNGTSGGTYTSSNRANIYINGNGICASERAEVVATVTAAPDFALSQTTLEICEGDTSDAVTITTGASDYDTFEWTPSLGVSGDATTGWSFDPTETTTYVLTASQSAGAECITTFEVQVNVNPLPTVITVVASETEVCDDTIVALSVTGNINNGIAILGNGTTAPGATAWPNPFSKFYGGTKHQMLYTAAELTAQGMMTGSEISAVTFDLAAVNTTTNGVCTDFTIRMGATTVGVMTEFISGTTTVYGPNSFTPTVAGLVSFTLNTPYVWDGVSNLIVETVHNTGNGGSGSGTTTKTTTTTSNSVFRGAKDNVAGGIAGLDATTFTVTGAHNQRPNMTFTYSLEQTAITWSPATNLYTDATATTAYVADDFATAVYFKSAGAGVVTYTATSHTDEGCSVSDSVELTVNQTPDAPVATSPQLIAEGQTIADIIVTGDNLTWYTDEDLTDEVDDSTVLTEGTYTFYVTDSMGDCTSEATMIVIEVSLSTKDFDTATFKAYPNPVKDYFNISYSKDIQNIAVVNMLGQTIFTKTVNATDTQIDMTALPTGTYFVKVNVDGAVKTIKVAKQ